MGQMTCASELKPYFHNNEDLWKKIGTISTEIGPAATKIVKFLPKKAYLSMGTPNELFIWKWTEDEDEDNSSDKNLWSFIASLITGPLLAILRIIGEYSAKY